MKIICIARNYRAHIEEMGPGRESGSASETAAESAAKSAIPETPQFFMKPDTALLRNNDPFYVPDFSRQVDYECELVVRINRVGRAIAEKFAHRYYDEVGLGIDFTARDLQREAIAKGLPWEACKSFDRSAALSSEFLKLGDLARERRETSVYALTGGGAGADNSTLKVGDLIQNLRFEMALNGEVRQRGNTAEMIFTVDRIIAHVSRFVTLKIGDLVYTGTPVGVGQVRPGDRLTASLEGRELLDFQIR